MSAAESPRSRRLLRIVRPGRIAQTAFGFALALQWATSEHRRLVRLLPVESVGARPRAPHELIPLRARGFVALVLRARRATCLERALVLQALLNARGTDCDVVIGVRKEATFAAHAWLDPLEPSFDYVELHRLIGNPVREANR